MSLQRKLLLGFSVMVLPTLLVGVQAIRTNALEGGTLEGLRQRLAHSRTYADVEDAMFHQTQVVWRSLGRDPAAKKEFPLTEQVVDYWLDRWAVGLPPDALKFADGLRSIEGDIRAVAARVFKLYDSGQREAAYLTARHEFVERLQPALAVVNREIYRQARELSVQRAVAEVQTIVEQERRVLWAIIFLALVAGLVASWLISRSLARPMSELREAMAVVGAGDLDYAIEPRSRDEIGELARAFAQMTEQLRQSRAQLIQSEKLASIGQMAAAVAHGLRNPLASLRAAAQLAQHRVESPLAREQLNAIVEQVDRLDLRSARLLAFSRPAPFHPLRESVRTLVEGALSGFAELLRQRRVELAVNCAAAVPEIRVDPMRLEQALTEIVSNALDAMPDGGRLEIGARAQDGAAGATGEQALELLERLQPDVVFADVRLPGMSGLDLLKRIRDFDPVIPVIMVTAYGSIEGAVEAVKLGAFDYVKKPVDLEELKLLADRARQIAALDETPPVLLTGEPGTGKGLLAHAIHASGSRAVKAFIEVNCTALPATLMEAELFGYERGAFTDAKESKPGLVEAAEGGFLFLDEIGDVDLSVQGKLLRAIEERAVRRVGSVRERKIDFRIVAATNRDLEREARQERFRKDLYFRLAVIVLDVPPLRQRGSDVLLLTEHFLRSFNAKYGKVVREMSAAARDLLLSYPWPGNVRELSHVIERAVLWSRGPTLDIEHLAVTSPTGVGSADHGASRTSSSPDGGPAAAPAAAALPPPGVDLAQWEKSVIERALREAGGNQTKAAQRLGLSSDAVGVQMSMKSRGTR